MSYAVVRFSNISQPFSSFIKHQPMDLLLTRNLLSFFSLESDLESLTINSFLSGYHWLT
jgi:hypothetical protein